MPDLGFDKASLGGPLWIIGTQKWMGGPALETAEEAALWQLASEPFKQEFVCFTSKMDEKEIEALETALKAEKIPFEKSFYIYGTGDKRVHRLPFIAVEPVPMYHKLGNSWTPFFPHEDLAGKEQYLRIIVLHVIAQKVIDESLRIDDNADHILEI